MPSTVVIEVAFMNIRYVLAGVVLFGGLATTSSGCSSAQSTCDLVCDCEHCGDPKEDVTCLEYEAQEAEADAYECSDAWEKYMTCVQEKGTCNEKEANFSTRSNGTCSDTDNLGFNCATDADCQNGFPGKVTCSGGSCVASRCSGRGDYWETNAD